MCRRFRALLRAKRSGFILGLMLSLLASTATGQSLNDPFRGERLRFYECATIGGELKGEERKAVGIACLRDMLGSGSENLLPSKLRDAQQLERWDTAWETALPGDVDARAIVESHCRRDAKESIYATVEGVSSVFLEVEKGHAFESIYIETDSSGGIGYSPLWFHLGELAIEADASIFGDPKLNHDNLPIVLFTKASPVYRKKRQSKIVVAFRHATTPDEESKGVYGRTISIINGETKQLLGERTEFFWMSPPGFRNGIRQQFAICPMVGRRQKTPSYFIRKVINPSLLPCFRELSEGHIKLDRDRRIDWKPRLPGPEDHAYWEKYRKQEDDLMRKHQACYEASKGKLPPRPE